MKWIYDYRKFIPGKKQNNKKFQESISMILKKHTQNKLKQIDNQEKIETFLLELDLCAKIMQGFIEINKNSVGMHITFLFDELYILNSNEFSDARRMMQLALELAENIVYTTQKDKIKMEIHFKFNQ